MADAVDQLEVPVELTVFLGHPFDLGGDGVVVVLDQRRFDRLLGAVASIHQVAVIGVANVVERGLDSFAEKRWCHPVVIF